MSGRGLVIRAARLAVAGAAVLGASAAGAHLGDPEAVHTCVEGDGTMRVVAAEAACNAASQQSSLDWRRGGVPGPQGPPGPAGDTGPQGAVGPAGGRGATGRELAFERVEATEVLRAKYVQYPGDSRTSAPAPQRVAVLCPEGSRAVSGGIEVPEASRHVTQMRVDEALPNLRGWHGSVILADETRKATIRVTVFATCVATASAPAHADVRTVGGVRERCAAACAPSVLSQRSLLRLGVPASVRTSRRPTTISAVVRCLSCRNVPRGAASGAASGPVIGRKRLIRKRAGVTDFTVRLTGAGKRAVRRGPSTRLVLETIVRTRGARTRRSTRPIRVVR